MLESFLWRGILNKIVIRSGAVRHYIILHGYVSGDTISYLRCCLIVMEIPLCCTTCCFIVTGVVLYHNGDAVILYHMLLYPAQ